MQGCKKVFRDQLQLFRDRFTCNCWVHEILHSQDTPFNVLYQLQSRWKNVHLVELLVTSYPKKDEEI